MFCLMAILTNFIGTEIKLDSLPLSMSNEDIEIKYGKILKRELENNDKVEKEIIYTTNYDGIIYRHFKQIIDPLRTLNPMQENKSLNEIYIPYNSETFKSYNFVHPASKFTNEYISKAGYILLEGRRLIRNKELVDYYNNVETPEGKKRKLDNYLDQCELLEISGRYDYYKIDDKSFVEQIPLQNYFVTLKNDIKKYPIIYELPPFIDEIFYFNKQSSEALNHQLDLVKGIFTEIPGGHPLVKGENIEANNKGFIDALLNNMYPLAKGMIVTPESQTVSRKFIDFSVKSRGVNGKWSPFVCVEVKCLAGEGWLPLMEQGNKYAKEVCSTYKKDRVFLICAKGNEMSFFLHQKDSNKEFGFRDRYYSLIPSGDTR